VHVQVTTPKHLNAEQKKLLKRLAETLEESEQNGGKNLFEKVKDVFG
jgi:DnaJ-class molecular chaperone